MPRQSPNRQLPDGKQFLGVVLPRPLAAELKSTATARGTSASDLVRDALSHYLAIASNPRPSDKVTT